MVPVFFFVRFALTKAPMVIEVIIKVNFLKVIEFIVQINPVVNEVKDIYGSLTNYVFQ